MPFLDVCTISSAHRCSLSTLRKHLKTTVVLTAALLAAASARSEARQYVDADGSMTSDLEAARASWRNDVEFNGNVGLGVINADAAYAMGFTGKDANIGFIDQPVWAAHPEFAGRLTFLPTSGTRVYTDPYIPVEAGDPFVADGRQYIDGLDTVSAHGTHVAGIAGANRDGTGTMGVAFDADLFAANSYDPGPEDGRVKGNDGAVYGAAWQVMIDAGVDIVTDSWGIGLSVSSWSYVQAYSQFQEIEAIRGTPDGGAYDGAIKAARSGIVVEFSAGNDGGRQPDAMAGLASFVPDIEKHWLTTMSVVADTKNPHSKSSSSSICGYAKYYCVAAPGTQINSSIPGSDIVGLKRGDIVHEYRLHTAYHKFGGTSVAGPFATGAFAVMKERYPYLANGELNEILKTTATDLGDAGVDDVFGWGLIDLEKALKGPAQFLGRFEAKLPGFYRGSSEEVWSNDISQGGLDQRKGEDQQTIADWEARKIAERWQNGVREEAIQKIRNDVAAEVTPHAFSEAIKLVRVRYEAADAVACEGGSEEAFNAAEKAMHANPIAIALWNAFGAMAPNTSIPQTAQFVDFTGTPEGSLDTIRATTAEERVAGATSEFNAYEALVHTLAAKRTEPNNYSGGLTKSGIGTLRLTGHSTYRDDTLINGGLLAVDGSITSKVVANMGTLGGIGAVGGIEVAVGGIVSPGNSIGTLTSNGNVIFDKGSVLHIEVDEDNSDQLVVDGPVRLSGGVVTVTPPAGADPEALMDRTYTIITSTGGVSGKFDDVQGDAFSDTTLLYLPNEVRLHVTRNATAWSTSPIPETKG